MESAALREVRVSTPEERTALAAVLDSVRRAEIDMVAMILMLFYEVL